MSNAGKQKGNPFAPESRSNPTGFRTREITVEIEVPTAGDEMPESGEPLPLRIAISSEAPVERMDWMEGRPFLEVLDHGPGAIDLTYARDGLPFLLDHDLSQQIGIGTPPVLGTDRVLRTEVTSGHHPDAGWVFADMAAGIRRKVSIGYWPGDEYTETRQADGTVVRRYRNWMLFEASSVAVPADYSVGLGRGMKPKDDAAGRPITDFPTEGGDKPVSLNNSGWEVFPLEEALELRDEYPTVWDEGGNILGNQQFERLRPIVEQGGDPETPTQEEAIRLREAWAARHENDFQLPGVVAQVKWLVVGSRGLDYMRRVLEEATDRVDDEDDNDADNGDDENDDNGRGASGRATASRSLPAAAHKAQIKEQTMDSHTAPVPGTAPASDSATRDRPQQLAVLARDFPTQSRLAEWIVEGVTVDAARQEVMTKLAQAAATQPKVTATPGIDVGADREADRPWSSNAEFFRAVRAAGTGMGTDKRLHADRAASGLGVQVGADGGFLVPEQFATGIVKYAFETGQILSRVNRIPVSGNQYHMTLVDESARTTGNRWGGIRGYWVGEGDTITTSKPKVRRATLDVTKKLAVAAYVTAEQLEDAPATSTMLDQAFGEEVAFLTEAAIFEGSGVGQPLGILNSNAFVTVAKESSQSTASIVAANVVKMRARLTPRSRPNAVFFCHLDAEPELQTMSIGNQPVYLPPGGLAGNPLGQLLGIPVVPVEHCPALGTPGDLLLADMSWYALGEKASSTMARSMHVRFLNDEETFRMTYRVDGFPMLQNPITPNKGSNTLSAFVGIATRP